MGRPPDSAETICLLGFHAIRARLRADPQSIQQVWIDRTRRDGRLKALLAELANAGIEVQQKSSDDLDQKAQGVRHQGVLALAIARQMPDDLQGLLAGLSGVSSASSQPGRFLVFLDGVTDPHNLGAILRTADAAGAAAVVAPKDHSAPLTSAVSRVAAGAAEHLPYLQVTNLSRAIALVQDHGFQVYGLDDQAPLTIYETDLSGNIVLVLGAEGTGLRRLVREQCDALVRIPMAGSVSSLNVSVACGVACYERVRQSA